MHTLIVGHFRRRVDAEGHLRTYAQAQYRVGARHVVPLRVVVQRSICVSPDLRILKQMMPSIPFEIVFDVMPDELETCVQQSPECPPNSARLH